MNTTQQAGPDAPADIANLEAEANLAMAGAPLEVVPGELGEVSSGPPVDPAAAFRPAVQGAVGMLSIAIFPQWKLSDEEKAEWAESMSLCLGQVFPGGFEGPWACWLRLLTCSGVIVVSRVAANGGKLPPLGPKLEDEKPALEHGTPPQAP